MTLPPVLYRGSVKNVRGKATSQELFFEFTDRFSVFDWGEMPDEISGKGQALCIMGKMFFRHLEKKENWQKLFEEIAENSHFDKNWLEALSQSKEYKSLCHKGLYHHAILEDSLEQDCINIFKVKSIEVLKPLKRDKKNYDYSAYLTKPSNVLVPLEIIFRMGLPEGNSLSKRLTHNPMLARELGLEGEALGNEMLAIPILDFSTKLEQGDRYLTHYEAQRLAALSDEEWGELKTMALLIGLNLYQLHQKMGMELWDGKVEFAMIPHENSQERSFMLVDSIGIDELRIQKSGKNISKEFLRDLYKKSNWFKNLEKSKAEAQKLNGDFKSICINKYNSSPDYLSQEELERASFVYKSYCNELALVCGNKTPFSASYNLMQYIQRYL